MYMRNNDRKLFFTDSDFPKVSY